MSDTSPPGRDSSGRFVKTETPTQAPVGDDQMHPIAKLLFGWVSAKSTPGLFFWGAIIICAGLMLADLAIHRHEYLHFAEFNGFYGIWGFGAFALAVLSGWPLGRLLRRDEDFYGEGDATPQDAGVEDEA
ncbi:MAG: hypothetical protein MRY64_13720 [Hyphomonadaceae bacterium]|nr:hypothetical protein [Hyphomonadaceae bacterium]